MQLESFLLLVWTFQPWGHEGWDGTSHFLPLYLWYHSLHSHQGQEHPVQWEPLLASGTPRFCMSSMQLHRPGTDVWQKYLAKQSWFCSCCCRLITRSWQGSWLCIAAGELFPGACSRANRGCCREQGSSGVLAACCGLGPLTSEQTFGSKAHDNWESAHCFLRDPDIDTPTLVWSGPLEESLWLFLWLQGYHIPEFLESLIHCLWCCEPETLDHENASLTAQHQRRDLPFSRDWCHGSEPFSTMGQWIQGIGCLQPSLRALLLWLFPPPWAGDQRNLPTAACPVNPVPNVLEKPVPALLPVTAAKRQGTQSCTSQAFYMPFCSRPTFVRHNSNTQLLLSLTFPWYPEGQALPTAFPPAALPVSAF